MTTSPPRERLRTVFTAALAAVDPAAAVHRHCHMDGDAWSVGGQLVQLRGRVIVIGAGKASAPMAQAVEAQLGQRISGGVVVVKYGHGAPLTRISLMEAAHPVPDAAGERGAQALEQTLIGLRPNDVVVACISGGASALLPAPRAGVSLIDKQSVTALLLASGADIREINAVRKHLSRLKGGHLVRQAAPARVVALILSDVIGDDLSTIASGPTVPDTSTTAEVAAIIARYDLQGRLPAAVVEALLHKAVETPKAGDPAFFRTINHLVGSNALAMAAAAEAARALGLDPVIISEPITGEARDAASTLVKRAVTIAAGSSRPRLLIAGGETTVTLGSTPGRGGRAQEFALAAGLALSAVPHITVLAAGSDGTDGPTDAAGGFADAGTALRAAEHGLNARDFLLRHDAYPLLAATDDLFITGPTRTNVMDLYLALID